MQTYFEVKGKILENERQAPNICGAKGESNNSRESEVESIKVKGIYSSYLHRSTTLHRMHYLFTE
jgi:hypothetical protein